MTGADDIELGTVDAGSSLSRRITLTSPDTISVTVTLSGPNAADITLVYRGQTQTSGTQLEAQKRLHISLVIALPLIEGPFEATIGLGAESVTVRGDVRVFSLGAGVDLGEVVLGETALGTVEVRNHARAALDVDIAAIASPFSSTITGAQSIPAGGALDVPVELCPSGLGPASTSVEVTAGGVTKTANVDGTGIAPEERFAAAVKEGEAGGSTTYASGTNTGEFQRLYLHVPTKNTNVSFGKEYDAALHDPTHAGFSATTEGHVLVRNRTESATMTYQAKDQVWVQSTADNVYLGAGDGGMSFIAGGGVYLSSGKGVVLAAGHGDIGELNEFASGLAPPVPAVAAIGDAMSNVALGWTVANMLMAGFGMTYGAARMGLALKNIKKNKKWKSTYNAFLFAPFAGFVKTATTTGMAMHDLINKKTKGSRDPVLPTESINMFAEGGFLSGTWGFCSIYGLTGATFRSLNAGMLGLVSASLDSLVATGAYGTRSAGLSALKTVSVDGGLRNQIGTPKGSVDIKGPDITMTGTAGHLVQGAAGVSLAAPAMKVKAGTVFAAQGAQVNASAKTKMTYAVAETYGVEITPAGVKVGSLSGKAINPALPMIEIGPAGVTLSGGPAGPVQLKMTPAGVAMSGPGNNLRHMGLTLFSTALRVELC
ncbi:MAG: hypothetical protein AB8I08_06260 [Sandaracinaceae bacterium]